MNCLDLIARLNQPQLKVGIQHLSVEEQHLFFSQLERRPLQLLERQRLALLQKPKPLGPCHPPSRFTRINRQEDCLLGEQRLRQGKVGCLILSGGQGSRLNSSVPKALLPISPVLGRSPLQIFCDKMRLFPSCPLAVMTSPFNHAAIRSALEGYGLERVSLFIQETLPFLDDRGNWMLEKPGVIAEGPNGNGYALRQFFSSGLWAQWRRWGVETVHIIPIDNPLADPLDPYLAAFHAQSTADVVMKCIEKGNEDKVGIIVEREGKIGVVEYSEIPSTENLQHYPFANINLFSFSMNFIEKISEIDLPLHLARKTANILLSTAKGTYQEQARIWKYETFLFDLLDHSMQTDLLVDSRAHTYAPLKEKHHLEAVQAALQAASIE